MPLHPLLPPDSPVTTTVYSALWPETEALVRHCMTQETEAMLAQHRGAHTKRQDAMHAPFFAAWAQFAQSTVTWGPAQFPETYPCAGSSEALREIIRMARWQNQDLVIFDGEYEGYEANATMQGTRVHRVGRRAWRQTLAQWAREGTPWRGKAQWWISQPSALDGNVWPDFGAWLDAVDDLNARFPSAAIAVWVDLCYLGATTGPWRLDVALSPAVAGMVFSLSKVMGVYYRRIGGCWARDPVPGLWGNRWFKNLDSLYLGQRWLEGQATLAQQTQWQAVLAERQRTALATLALQGPWRASDVALLCHAPIPFQGLPANLPEPEPTWWAAAARGQSPECPASRRLCLTPLLVPGGGDGQGPRPSVR
jgi:hypothetical protein